MPGIISPTGPYSRIRMPYWLSACAELIAHAGQLLGLVGRLRQAVFLQQRQHVGDRADIVRAGGQRDAALAFLARNGADQHLGHLLEVGVGVPFFGPDRVRPAHPLGVDRLVVPVGALDQPDGHLAAGAAGPVDDALGVVGAAAQVRLQGQAGGEIDRLAAPLEQRERQVLQRELLHVEVYQHVVLGGRLRGSGAATPATRGASPRSRSDRSGRRAS